LLIREDRLEHRVQLANLELVDGWNALRAPALQIDLMGQGEGSRRTRLRFRFGDRKKNDRRGDGTE
jgi:hypothetical protein